MVLRLVDRPEWKEHCEEWGGGSHSPLFWKLYNGLSCEDVSALVKLYGESSKENERVACCSFFFRLLKDRDRRFTQRSREVLGSLLFEKLAVGRLDAQSRETWSIPENWAMALGGHALTMFREKAARERCFDVELFTGLVLGPTNRKQGEDDSATYAQVFPDVILGCDYAEALDLTLCSVGVQRVLVGHLYRLGSNRAIQALRALDGVAEAKERALIARELLGDAPGDRIEALAHAWRRTNAGETLREFFHRYLDWLPVGTVMTPWLELLGEPTTNAAGCVTYTSSPEPLYALYIDLDADGGLRGMSLKDY